jgi:hypothetical protein
MPNIQDLFRPGTFQYAELIKSASKTEENRDVPQVYDKDRKDIKSSLTFEVDFDPMKIVVVAVHKEAGRNHKVRIPCVGCLPMPGYQYSTVNDTYTSFCIDHVNLGFINVSYVQKMRGTGGWECKIPMPEAVIRRYLSLEQRKLLREFQDKHKDKGEEITFEFVQMVSAY